MTPPENITEAIPSRVHPLAKLQTRLVLGFVAVTAIATLAGIGGLFFIDRVAETATVLSETTSPLLSESIELVRSAQRMRAAVSESMQRQVVAEEAVGQLRQLADGTHTHLDRLIKQGRKARLSLQLEPMLARELEFVSLLEDTLKSAERERTAARERSEALKSFEAARTSLEEQLTGIINRAEGRMAKAEDEIKVQVQTGTSTAVEIAGTASSILTETYPVVQGAYKLTREAVRLKELVELYLSAGQANELTAVETDLKSLFKTASGLVRKLGGRLRDSAGKLEIESLRRQMELMEAQLFGAGGLLAVHRQAVAAGVEIGENRANLESIEREYFATLRAVEDAIRRLNSEAEAQTIGQISSARTLISALAVMAAFASIALGLLFAYRIARPIADLTRHLRTIRLTGSMNPLDDTRLTGRADEIGSLALSFDAMIMELEKARRSLVESSEAEIRLQYERLNGAVSNMPLGLCMTDAERKLVICNRQFTELCGLDAARPLQGALMESIVADGSLPASSAAQQLLCREIVRLCRIQSRSDEIHELENGRVVAATVQPLAGGGRIVILQDVTERHQAEAKIAHMALHDALTDLPNRVMLREELLRSLDGVGHGLSPAVLCLDLDHFKAVNDTLGHPVGDELLKAVAERLRRVVGDRGSIARLGGDEFAVVQPAAEQPGGASLLAAEIVREIGEPYEFREQQVVVGASIGIAVAPTDGTDPDQLLRNADLALYRAKYDGKGRYSFFEAEMDAKAQERRTLELDLRKALALKEFRLNYQPQVRVDSGQLTSFEALIRWHHPTRGLVPPALFIPLAEEVGLIGAIGSWVLKEACTTAATWPDDIRIAVNLSAMQFASGTIVLEVIAALGASGLRPNRLELEITETVLLKDTDGTLKLLRQLRDLGVRISMDDFGTGYSSLGYLQRFPFDKIKIDQSFIRDLGDKPESIAIVRAVTSLAQSLGITTTAEGVETDEQLQKLRLEGCTEAQGYLFSRPASAEDAMAFIRGASPQRAGGPPGEAAISYDALHVA